jgi:hypothetical protein
MFQTIPLAPSVLRSRVAVCYNSLVMMDAFLVPEKTVVSTKGDGSSIDVGGATSRVFLLTLKITRIIEQESLDISIYGSSDGAAWDPKPMLSFPQKFYRGEQPLLLDLTEHASVKFVRAHWELNRWGRGSETPMFEFQVTLKEVPPDVLREASVEVKTTA